MPTAELQQRKTITDFHSLCTKHAPNLIQDNQATALVNFDAYRHDLRRRQAISRLLGPPSKPRLLLSHEDLQARKWMLAHCENGEIYFTRNIETAVGSEWTQILNGGSALGLNANYLPWGCSFNGSAYFVNGFNGTVKFGGTSACTVPAVPTCRIIAPGPRRLMAIGLIDAPEYMRLSALDDGDIWSGTEMANSIYSKTSSDQLPDIQQYLFKVGLSGDHVVGYAKFRTTHVFFGSQGVYAAWRGLDPLGFTVPEERFTPFRLTSAIGCLNGRSVVITPDGLLVWQGNDGQLYAWTGEIVGGAAGVEQWGTSIFCLTDPKEPQKPNIANLMDFNNKGYQKPQYDLSAVGADTQAEWVALTTKTNVDTTTEPGTLMASKDASTIAKKEYYEGTVNSYVLLHGTTREHSQRFKCTETSIRSRMIIKIQWGGGPKALKWQIRTDNGGPPSDTVLAEGRIEVNTSGDYQLTIDFDPERLPSLTLDSYYHIVLLGYGGQNDLGLVLKCVNPGGYSDGSMWIHYSGNWIEEPEIDLWFQVYGSGMVYQASSVGHGYYDKGDATSSWGLFAVDSLIPLNTSLLYYLKCAATAAEVDTAAEITEAVTNGEAINVVKFGGDNPANRFVGIKIVGATTTPFDKTWKVYRAKATFVLGSVASALSQAAVYSQVYHLSLMEQDLVTKWNPSGTKATVNNTILTMDRDIGFRLLRGFKADETNQTDFAFNSLVLHNGKLYGALANPIGVGGSGYTTGSGKETSGGSGSGCTVNISTVSGGKITAVASAPTAGGTGYAVGDYLPITTGGTGGYVRVTAVNAGVVTAVSLTSNYICKFDVDQEYDLLDDADHKILGLWEGKDDDFGMPSLVKIFDAEHMTREELGSDCPFQMEYGLDGASTLYLLGFSQKELKDAVFGCMTAVASAPTAGGSGYAVGDFLWVTEGSNGIVRVKAVASGVVTQVELWAGGSRFTTGTGKATTKITGSGSGCTVNITSILSGYSMIYPETNTLGFIGKNYRTVSPSWPKSFNSLTPYYQDRIFYPNKTILEPSYEAHSTVGRSLRKRLKTTNKIRLQSVETRWRPKDTDSREVRGYKVEDLGPT